MFVTKKISYLLASLCLLLLTQCQNKTQKITPAPSIVSKLDIKQIEESFKKAPHIKGNQANQRTHDISPLFFANLDNKAQIHIGEEVLLGWDYMLCCGPAPSTFSIYLMKDGVFRGVVAQNINTFSKEIPEEIFTGNFLWTAPRARTFNDPNIAPGTGYSLYMQARSGEAMGRHNFELLAASNQPVPCAMTVAPNLDDDYKFAFDIRNNNDCYQNITYRIGWGDGTTEIVTKSSDFVKLYHQYPFGVNKTYKVTIGKYDGYQILSTKTVSVYAKRD